MIRIKRTPLVAGAVVFAMLSVCPEHLRAQTQDQVSKFDTAGNLVDSTIQDSGGFIGIRAPNVSGSVLQLHGQDGLTTTGYQPFLTLEDNNARGARGRIQSASGNLYFFPERFIGGSPAVSITQFGTVGIGTDQPLRTLDVRGVVLAEGYEWYSSRRWKENITPIDHALAKVERLRGVYYDWKKTKAHDIGLIAEEVGAVVPEVVTYEPNGQDARSVDYARLTPLLVEAVKELKAENQALQRKIEVLENASAPLTASVPSTSGFTLIGLGALGVLGYAWRQRKGVAASGSSR